MRGGRNGEEKNRNQELLTSEKEASGALKLVLKQIMGGEYLKTRPPPKGIFLLRKTLGEKEGCKRQENQASVGGRKFQMFGLKRPKISTRKARAPGQGGG